MAVPTTPSKPQVSLDQSIEQMRKQLAEFAPFLGKGTPTRSLEEFDLETERLIGDLLGQASELLHAYEYAELGEAAGLVNMTDEAPEGTRMDSQRQSLLQRSRVLESCVSELEARRSAEPKKTKIGQALIGPQIEAHMSTEVRSVSQNASLRDAGQLMQESARPGGINVEVIREPNDGYWSEVWMQKAFVACYWSGRPTENWMFSQVYAADASWNDTFWKHDRFNELLVMGRAELDSTKRREIYVEMQQIVHHEGGVCLPLFLADVHATTLEVRHPEIIGNNWELDGGKCGERWWFA